MRRVLAVGVAGLLLATAACGGEGADGQGAWQEGEQRGRWTLKFTGYGEASSDGDNVRLGPRAAADRDITHGALAVDAQAPADLSLSGRVTTVEQRRDGTPNPWEVGWVLWRYSDPDHFYAIALKPNGWELSKQDPAYPGKQRFLASGTTPTFAVGTSHAVDVVAVGPTMTVRADGHPLATVTDSERPYLSGSVAVYTEDAVVDFSQVQVGGASTMPGWALPPVPAKQGTGPGGPASSAPAMNRTTS